MTTKYCDYCGKKYIPSKHSHHQKYCSKSCCWKKWDSCRPISRVEYMRKYQKKWRKENIRKVREYGNEWGRNKLKEYKLEVIKKFDGQCKKCGYSNWKALQVDHIDGKGYKDRKFLRKRRTYYKYLINTPIDELKNYQLLCSNCNWIKKYDNNENSNLLSHRG